MRILALMACAVAVAAAQPADLAARLEAMLATEFRAGEPGGVVLVAREGKTLFRQAYGMADVEGGVAMTPDAVMRLGSVTKQFTAVGILQLVEQRRLALDDDVRKYVPALQTHGRLVTIEHLLTHTSGLATMVDVERFWEHARRDHDVAALLALTRDRPALFEPGAAYEYNDSGYIALGAVIERVAGVSYASFIESMVGPLGMRDTRYGDDARIISRRARGYSVVQGRIVNARYISMTVPHAAGALVSTADDLLRWTTALRRGDVIDRSLLAKAWTPRTMPDGTSSGYGYGWNLCAAAGRPTIEHGGWINGFTAKVIALRDEDLVVIALVNRDEGSPDAAYIAQRAMRLVVTGSLEVKAYVLDAAARRTLVGTYRGEGAKSVRQIVERDGVLYLVGPGDVRQRLVPISPTELSPAESEGTVVLRFRVGAGGRADELRTFVNCARGERRTRVD